MAAIPLVIFEGDTCRFNEDAAEFLCSLKGDIGAVTVAGAYRQGKSTFINRVLLGIGKAKGFAVGTSINAQTKGLWIFTKTFTCVDKNGSLFECVVIDTEGLGDTEGSNTTHDTRIFSLALLLSSFFIYNTMGTIDEGSISTLNLVTEISKQVHMSADRSEEENVEDLSKIFPSLMWLVRDFCLDLVDSNGAKMSPNEWLERSLASKPESSEAMKERNRTRALLRRYFPQRSCCTLSTPVDSKEKLKEMDHLPNSQLNKSFVAEIKALKASLASTIPKKTVVENSRAINGPMFVGLCRAYTEAINNKKAPVIRNAWTLICEIQSLELVSQTIAKFTASAEALQLPCASNYLDQTLSTMKKSTMAWFEKQTNAQGQDHQESYTQDHCLKIEEGILASVKTIEDKNTTKLTEWVAECVEQIDVERATCVSMQDLKTKVYDSLRAKANALIGVDQCSTSEAVWGRKMLPKVWAWAQESLKQREQDCSKANQVIETLHAKFQEVKLQLEAQRDESCKMFQAQQDESCKALESLKSRAQEEIGERTAALARAMLANEQLEVKLAACESQAVMLAKTSEEQVELLKQEIEKERELCEEARCHALSEAQRLSLDQSKISPEIQAALEAYEDCQRKIEELEEEAQRREVDLVNAHLSLVQTDELRATVKTLSSTNALLETSIKDYQSQQTKLNDLHREEKMRIRAETTELIAETRATQDAEAESFVSREKLFKDELAKSSHEISVLEKRVVLLTEEVARLSDTRKSESERMQKELSKAQDDLSKKDQLLTQITLGHESSLEKMRSENFKELKTAREKLAEATSQSFKEKSALVDKLGAAEVKAVVIEAKYNDLKRRNDEQESLGDRKRMKTECETLKIEKAHMAGELAQLITTKKAQQRDIDELNACNETLKRQLSEEKNSREAEKTQMTFAHERQINECRRKAAAMSSAS